MSEEIEGGTEDVQDAGEVLAADPVPEPQQAGGPGVAVYQGLPDVTMVVNEGNVVSPSGDDRSYEGGETITVDGPTAIALAAGGHASAVGPSGDNGSAPVGEAPAE